MNLYQIPVAGIDGTPGTLAPFQGQVLLIVNVASRCRYTSQYAALELLYRRHRPDGFAVLGFPCNQFGEQEPGSDEEVAAFCQKNYGVKFDMFSKVDVNGDKAAPLFKELTSKEPNEKDRPVRWNFEKFLVSKKGEVVARFRTGVEPDDTEVVKAIEAELAK